MSIEDRRLRERTARRGLITATARTLAEREGWEAVTTRRLSTEIEYSQPMLHKHFASMEDIIEAVAPVREPRPSKPLTDATVRAGRRDRYA